MIKMKNLPFAFDEGKCANVGDDSKGVPSKTTKLDPVKLKP